jgi:phage terminase large subunit-like protein
MSAYDSEATKVAKGNPEALARFRSGIGSFRQALQDWPLWADKRQLPPEGDWHGWLMLAGRGFGKTRAGAEWIHALAEENGAIRIALVGATIDEARSIMVEGQSGILATRPRAMRPKWEPSRGRLKWRTGAEAFLYSGEAPEKLRGPEHHFAWCDELAKWAWPKACWDMLQMGMRLGETPRTLVTTTPRPLALLRQMVDDPGVVTVRGEMAENRLLPDAYIERMRAEYGGTRLGRQELDGELIEDAEGALWTRDGIEACRMRIAPELVRVVIGVDPPASSSGDACGIVAVGLCAAGKGWILADESVSGESPEGWARAVATAAVRWQADRVIAEKNNGGEMVESVLRAADVAMPVRLVHASKGKVPRAEPVAALYERGCVHHAGAFPALEDELCGLIVGGGYEGPGRSPDRADALVWAVSELMLKKRGEGPRVRVV